MDRFIFEHGDFSREFYIFDTLKGQRHTSHDRIATVYDVDLAQKLVEILNAEAGKEYLCRSAS